MKSCGCSTRRPSHLNFFAATLNSWRIRLASRAGAGADRPIPPRLPPLRNDGVCDFENGLHKLPASAAQWSAKALPTVVPLARATEALFNPSLALPPRLVSVLATVRTEHFLALMGALVRVQQLDADSPYAVLLPVDRLFEVRTAAALRLWRGLIGRRPGPDPGALTAERRQRFILALRALDARLQGATYPDIAAGLFDTSPISRRDWISHELRDQTGRLVRLGFKMMRGGYRQLLLYPYRRRV